MRFGKFRNIDVAELPDNYLDWLERNNICADADLAAEVKEEWAWRDEADPGRWKRATEEYFNRGEQRQGAGPTAGGREQQQAAPPPPPPSSTAPVDYDLRVMVDEILVSGYRAVAKRYHPDTGGDGQAMLLVNRAYEYLRGFFAKLK